MTYSRLATAGLAATLLIFSGSLVAQQKEVAFDSAGDYLKLPADIHFGEVAGVATTATGNVWVYNQGGGLNLTVGAARLHPAGGARLFEFDRSGKFLRELGSTNEERPYGFRSAQGVRVDPQNNVWVVDRGSRTIMKFDPSGRILMVLGRTPEAIGEIGSSAGAGPAGGAGRGAGAPGALRSCRPRRRRRGRRPPGAGVPGDNFNQPTDVAWDAAGNIFVSDGYTNARVAKFDKTGRFAKSWGGTGT